jgi:hypothetical protein
LRAHRQLRGYARITANPTVVATMLCAAGFVALRARNADGLVRGSADGHAGTVLLGEAGRLAGLSLATLVGLAVATAVATAVVPGNPGPRGEETMALREPGHARRLALRAVAVTSVLVASLVLAAGLLAAVAAAQLVRAGVTPGIDLGATRPQMETLARVAVALPVLAAVGLLVAALVPSNPAVAVATSTGGAAAMLMLQHLMGHAGDVALPSAWLGRWLHLASADFGDGYVWTIGSFSSGRWFAGLGILAIAAAAAIGSWSLMRRAARL